MAGRASTTSVRRVGGTNSSGNSSSGSERKACAAYEAPALFGSACAVCGHEQRYHTTRSHQQQQQHPSSSSAPLSSSVRFSSTVPERVQSSLERRPTPAANHRPQTAAPPKTTAQPLGPDHGPSAASASSRRTRLAHTEHVYQQAYQQQPVASRGRMQYERERSYTTAHERPWTADPHNARYMHSEADSARQRRHQQADLIRSAAELACLRGRPEKAEQLLIAAAGIFAEPSSQDSSTATKARKKNATFAPARPAVATTTVASTTQRLYAQSMRLAHDEYYEDEETPRLVKTEAESSAATIAAPCEYWFNSKGKQQREDDAKIMNALGWKSEDQQAVVKIFRHFTDGRPELTVAAFSAALSGLGLSGDMAKFFRAFDRNNHGSWISSNDFLMGFVALDANTPHSGLWLNFRAGYLFRYYASRVGSTLKMSMESLEALCEDEARALHSTAPRRAGREEALRLNPSQQPLTQEQFLSALKDTAHPVAAHVFRFSILRYVDGKDSSRDTQ